MVKTCTSVVNRQLDFDLGYCCRAIELHYGTIFAEIKITLVCDELAFLENTLCCLLKVF